MENMWNILNQKTRLRLDKLPLLIETVRKYKSSAASVLQEIIDDREQIWPLEEPSAKKVQLELALSAKLHELWTQAEKEDSLKNNINFMALRKEITDLGEEIDQMTNVYNEKIYRYNRHLNFIVWRPLTLIFGFKRMSIFEFEP